MLTKQECVSCRDNPLAESKPAEMQLCGYWLCRDCLEVVRERQATYRLAIASKNGLRDCWRIIRESLNT
jgi:hypothetical protein